MFTKSVENRIASASQMMIISTAHIMYGQEKRRG